MAQLGLECDERDSSKAYEEWFERLHLVREQKGMGVDSLWAGGQCDMLDHVVSGDRRQYLRERQEPRCADGLV